MAGTTSTTVDLSRLPAPAIVELLDLETIRAAMIADLQASGIAFDALVPSDPAIKLIDVVAYRELLLRQAFQDAALQLLVAYARGANLDALAALLGIARLEIAPADALTGALPVMEDDDSLRQRVVLAPEQFAAAGPELAYVSRAKGASGDVLDASATSPAPGDVLVTVLSRVGDGTAAPALLAAVTAVVTDRGVRPIGDAVTVASAALVPVTVRAALTTFAGPDIAVVLAAARAGLDTYLATNRRLGRDLTISGLHAALTVAGVEGVALAEPAGDVVCGPTQAHSIVAIELTHGGYAD